MPQPLKYATNAKRQAAYRARKKTPGEKIARAKEARQDAQVARADKPVSFPTHARPAPLAEKPSGCSMCVPRGIRCKACGKPH